MDSGIETFIQTVKQSLRRSDGATIELARRGSLSVCNVKSLLLAHVDDEPAGEALDLPPGDEVMERELVGREEVPPPVAIEAPAAGGQTVKRGYITVSHTCHTNLENRHEARSQVQPGTPVIQCDYSFLKTEDDAPMITVLVAIDAVYKQMVAILLRKERVTEIHSQVAVWPHSRDTSDIPK